VSAAVELCAFSSTASGASAEARVILLTTVYKDVYDKILVEETLRAQPDLTVTILRYRAVYGPNDMHRFGPWVRQMTGGAEAIRMQEGSALIRSQLAYGEVVPYYKGLRRTVEWERGVY
jgi:hypothetical protein